MRKFNRAMGFATQGLISAVKHHRNLRIQIAVGFMVSILGVVTGISILEWMILVLTIGLVIFAELLNTAIEQTVNLATYESRPEAKIAKDTAAGIVLFSSVVSIVIAILMFGPRLFKFP